MDICHCDWLDKEVGRAIAGQDKVRERAKQRMLGKRRVEFEEEQVRCRGNEINLPC